MRGSELLAWCLPVHAAVAVEMMSVMRLVHVCCMNMSPPVTIIPQNLLSGPLLCITGTLTTVQFCVIGILIASIIDSELLLLMNEQY